MFDNVSSTENAAVVTPESKILHVAILDSSPVIPAIHEGRLMDLDVFDLFLMRQEFFAVEVLMTAEQFFRAYMPHRFLFAEAGRG